MHNNVWSVNDLRPLVEDNIWSVNDCDVVFLLCLFHFRSFAWDFFLFLVVTFVLFFFLTDITPHFIVMVVVM